MLPSKLVHGLVHDARFEDVHGGAANRSRKACQFQLIQGIVLNWKQLMLQPFV